VRRFALLLLLHLPVAFVVLGGRVAPHGFVRTDAGPPRLERAYLDFDRIAGLPIGAEQRATLASPEGTGPDGLVSFGSGWRGGDCGLLHGTTELVLAECSSFSGPPLVSDGRRTYAVWEQRGGGVVVTAFEGEVPVAERAWPRPKQGAMLDPIDDLVLDGDLLRVRFGGDAVLEIDRHTFAAWPEPTRPLVLRFGERWWLYGLLAMLGVLGLATAIAWRGTREQRRLRRAAADGRIVDSRARAHVVGAPDGPWVAELKPLARDGDGAYRERIAAEPVWIRAGTAEELARRLESKTRRTLVLALGVVALGELALGLLL